MDRKRFKEVIGIGAIVLFGAMVVRVILDWLTGGG